MNYLYIWKGGMCDKSFCCEAINTAFGSFQLQLGDLTSPALSKEVIPNDDERTARTQLGITTLGYIVETVRATYAGMYECKKNGCCASAALSVSNIGLGVAKSVVSTISDPNIPLTATPPATFDVTQVLVGLVGNIPFPDAPANKGTLVSDIDLVLSSLDCPKQNACDRLRIKPERR